MNDLSLTKCLADGDKRHAKRQPDSWASTHLEDEPLDQNAPSPNIRSAALLVVSAMDDVVDGPPERVTRPRSPRTARVQ